MEDETRRPRLSHNYNLLKNRKAGFGPALYRLAEAFSLSDYCPHPSNQRRCCKIVLMFQNQSIQESLQGETQLFPYVLPLYGLPPASSPVLPLPLEFPCG